jgi:integrase
VLQYKIAGSDRRMTLGPYPGVTCKKARELAQAALGDKWHGKDPQADRRAQKAKLAAQTTLIEVIDLYLLDKKPELRPISFYETERYLRKVWKPLHGRPIKEIERSEVVKVLDQLKHSSGKTAAARARGSLSALFGWGIERGHADANPVIGTKNPDPHTQGERVLTGDELRALWRAADGGNDYDRIVRLLILTGCRKSEVGGMRWSEFNKARTVWTIPGDRTKNTQSHILPMPDMFWNIIDGIKPRGGSDNIFGYSNRGFRNWNKPKKALDRRSGISNWTHHDLRRTFRTGLGRLGIQPHIAELAINHSKAGLIAVYDKHTYEGEIAAALAQWCDHIRSIVEGTEPTIVPIRKGIAVIPGA